MKDKEIINNEKYHVCGRCKYEYTPDDKYSCNSCIYGTDHRTDLWELKQENEDKDIVIQTKNKKNLMLLNIINTAISMCNNKLEYTLEDTISYVKKSLKELEENEEASK